MMDDFYLNKYSLAIFWNIIFQTSCWLAVLKIAYQRKATKYLAYYFFSGVLVTIGYFLSHSYLNILAVLGRCLALISICLIPIHFAQFLYFLTHKKRSKKFSLYILLQISTLIVIIGYLIYAFFNHRIILNFTTHYYELVSASFLKYFLPYILLLNLTLSAYHSLIAIRTRNHILLLFALVFFLLSVVPAISINFFGRNVYMFVLSQLHIGASFLLMLLYVNHSKEKTSFSAKIAGISAMLFLVFFNFCSFFLLEKREEQYHSTRFLQLKLMVHSKEYPDTAQYLSRYTSSTEQKILWQRKPLQLNDSYHQPVFHRGKTGSYYTSSYYNYRNILYEAGFTYQSYRQYNHEMAFSLFIMGIFGYFIFLIGIPVFLHRSLIMPIRLLMQAVKDADKGNYRIKIPIYTEDEIGRLTIFFNKMLRSITVANKRLEILNNGLQKQAKEFFTLFNNLPVGVYRASGLPEFQFLQVNPALYKILEYSDAEKMKGISTLKYFATSFEKKKFFKLMKEKGECYRYEAQFKRDDGSIFWVAITARIAQNLEKMQTFFDGIIEDITAYKESQQQLNHMTKEIIDTNTAYQKFVPQQFLTYLSKDKITHIQLGDHSEKVMSVLFSDIRSFTSLSESMTPKDNFNFINSYLKRIGPKIRQNNGFIDKYIGDAIMALFAHSTENAIDAGIAMLEELKSFNLYRSLQGYCPISIGVGIHTGKLILGIVGEANRMDGTVISDAVNLSARLEGLTKTYGAGLLISYDSLQMVEDIKKYEYRRLSKVIVKGKSKAVVVVEILNGLDEQEFDLKQKTRKDFEQGIELYDKQEYASASQYFEKVLQLNSQDKAGHYYWQRCQQFQQHGLLPGTQEMESI